MFVQKKNLINLYKKETSSFFSILCVKPYKYINIRFFSSFSKFSNNFSSSSSSYKKKIKQIKKVTHRKAKPCIPLLKVNKKKIDVSFDQVDALVADVVTRLQALELKNPDIGVKLNKVANLNCLRSFLTDINSLKDLNSKEDLAFFQQKLETFSFNSSLITSKCEGSVGFTSFFGKFPISLSSTLDSCFSYTLYSYNVTNKKHGENLVVLPLSFFFQTLYTEFHSSWLVSVYVGWKSEIIKQDSNLSSLQKKAKLKQLIKKSFNFFVKDVLACFIELGFALSHVKYYDVRKESYKINHVITFPDWEVSRVISLYFSSLKRPMLVKPFNWVYNKEGVVQGGGFFASHKIGSALDMSSRWGLKSSVEFNTSYVNNLNLLQSFPIHLDEGLFISALNNWVFFHISQVKKAILKLVGSLSLEKEYKSCQYYFLNELNLSINKLNTFLLEIITCRIFFIFKSVDASSITLYSPVTIDRVGRMYNAGFLNLTCSKFFRQCIASFSNLKEDFDRSKLDLEILNKCLSLSTSQIGDKVCREFSYYSNLARTPNPIVFLDATASMLQIFSLVFGDVEVALFSNLHTTQYDPYMKISESWCLDYVQIKSMLKEKDIASALLQMEEWKDLLHNRDFLKKVFLLKLYGASAKTLQVSVSDWYREVNFPRMRTGWKGLNLIIWWVEVKLMERFHILFDLQAELRKKTKSLTSVKLFWQGNISSYSVFKTQNLSMDISSIPSEKVKEGSSKKGKKSQGRKRLSLVVCNYDKVDANANLRTIISGIFQSIDAAVAVKVRLRMLTKYNTYVYSIQDSYGCEKQYVSQLREEYKKALFEEAFDKQLSELLELPNFNLSKLEGQIFLNKQKQEWEELRNSFSEYCLKLE